MTEDQRIKLEELISRLMPDAIRVGPMHCNWDYIAELRGFMDGGKKTSIGWSVEKLIKVIEDDLNKRDER